MVQELLDAGGESAPRISEIFATEEWLSQNSTALVEGINLSEASEQELKKLSHLVTPQQVLALVCLPEQDLDPASLTGESIIGLESIRDPGNLGTIVRTAEWFGIRNIVCTPDSVDLYNPKVVQASMGAMARTRVYYTDLEEFIMDPALKEKAIYGTFLKGENIYETDIAENPMILFGNESRGLSEHFSRLLKDRLSIPSFAGKKGGPESLNLASSVAIVCSELKRRA